MPENTIVGEYGDWFDTVTFDGKLLDPAPSQALHNHSPDGFAWGYQGSGPAQLALAILLAAGVSPGATTSLYIQFMNEHLCKLHHVDFEFKLDVVQWADDKLFPTPKVTVVLNCDWSIVDERIVEVLDICEDENGNDVLTFKCPQCGFQHQSLRG